MGYILRFLVFALACYGTTLVSGQDCLPGFVENLWINAEGILSWETPEDEACEIAFYIVYIGLSDGTVVWTYTVDDGSTRLDVSFLIPCYSYTFRVHQVSTDDITGEGLAIFETTPPPLDADLALQYLQITRVDRNLKLDWSLAEEWIPCARRYRILTYNEDTDTALDFYTPLNSITMYNLVPCARYTFGVTALFTIQDEGPVTTVRATAPENYVFAPELLTYYVTSTSATVLLLLEEVQYNRCPITSLRVASIVPPVVTTSFIISNQDNRSPFTANIGNLQPDTMYVFNITANSTAGWSQPLVVGFQTRP